MTGPRCTCRIGASATAAGVVRYTALQAAQQRVLRGVRDARAELSEREFDALLEELVILVASLSFKGWRP